MMATPVVHCSKRNKTFQRENEVVVNEPVIDHFWDAFQTFQTVLRLIYSLKWRKMNSNRYLMICNLAAFIVVDQDPSNYTWRQTSSQWKSMSFVSSNKCFPCKPSLTFMIVNWHRNQNDQHHCAGKKLFLKIHEVTLMA